MLSFVLFDCCQRPLHLALQRAERLIQSHLDSALTVFKQYTAYSFSDSATIEVYVLLRTQTNKKNYIDHNTSDSLIKIAVYDKYEDDELKAKTHYYVERIYQNSDNDTLAVNKFLIAIPYVKRINNIDLLCSIKRNLATALWSEHVYEGVKPFYKLIMLVVCQNKDKLGIIYFKKNKPIYIQAKNYLDSTLIQTDYFYNKYIKSDLLYSLSEFYVKTKYPKPTIGVMRKNLIRTSDGVQKYTPYKISGQAFAEMNQADSAVVCLNKSLSINDLSAKADTYHLLKLIVQKKNDVYKCNLYNDKIIAYNDNDSLQLDNHLSKMISSIKDLIKNQSVAKYKSTNFRLKYLIAIILLVDVVLFILYSFKRKSNNQKTNRLVSKIQQKEQYISSLQRSTQETERQIRQISVDLQQKDKFINILHSDVSEKEQQIEKFNNEIKQSKQSIEAMQTDINRKRRIIENLYSNIQQRDKYIKWRNEEEAKKKKYYSTMLEFEEYSISKKVKNAIANNRNYETSAEEAARLSEEEWEEFYVAINKIFPGYIASLKERNNKLLDRDIKICCLSRLEFNYAEIALLFTCTPQFISERKKPIIKLLGYSPKIVMYEDAIKLQ